MRQPSHRAYVVADPKKDSQNKKAYWREVGVAWAHKKGDGFDIVIHDGISVSGRIVCTTPKMADPDGEAWFKLSD